jgi:hypothetical protein
MKSALIAAGIILASVGVASADTYVNGYTRKDGTYVAPHHRSSPDNSKLNNWNSQGNTNPYTGAQGTQNPYPTYPTTTQPTPRRW